MANLTTTRRRFKLAIAALLLLDLVVAAYLVSPSGRSHALREDEYSRLQNELQLKTKQLEPLRGIDKKLAQAKLDIDAFYGQRLPRETSAISATLGRLATRNSVQVSNVKYDYETGELPELRQVRIDAKLTGNYPQMARFINSLERSELFFLLDGVSLVEEQGGKVSLQLKLETYMRETS